MSLDYRSKIANNSHPLVLRIRATYTLHLQNWVLALQVKKTRMTAMLVHNVTR